MMILMTRIMMSLILMGQEPAVWLETVVKDFLWQELVEAAHVPNQWAPEKVEVEVVSMANVAMVFHNKTMATVKLGIDTLEKA